MSYFGTMSATKRKTYELCVQCFFQYHHEIFNVGRVNLAEGTETEGIGSAYLARIDSESTLITVVVHLLKTEAWSIWVLD